MEGIWVLGDLFWAEVLKVFQISLLRSLLAWFKSIASYLPLPLLASPCSSLEVLTFKDIGNHFSQMFVSPSVISGCN